jgi:hypothetical protein
MGDLYKFSENENMMSLWQRFSVTMSAFYEKQKLLEESTESKIHLIMHKQ